MSRFLLVDDDDRLADRLAVALTDRGHDVRVAYDGEAALQHAAAHLPERVVLDLSMPGMGGIEVLKRLRALVPDAQVVILTGYGSIPVTVDAIKLGAVDVLQKPVDVDGIVAAFEREHTDEPDSGPYDPPSLARAEWEHIQRVLADSGDNISEAARRLGLHRRTLQRKLAKRPPRS